MDGKRNEVRRTICVWCEKVSTHSSLDLERMDDMNMNVNESMVWLDTTITACSPCYDNLKLANMPPEQLMKTEMDMYRLMLERVIAISSSVWCMNENVYSTMWRFDPRSMQKPQKMFMGQSKNGTMSLRICADKNNTTVVTPSVIDYRNKVMDRIAMMSPPTTPTRR